MAIARSTFNHIGTRRHVEVFEMGLSTFRKDLEDFAVELRQLAYTMPAGHEDRLIHLSDRMAERSRQTAAVRQRGA